MERLLHSANDSDIESIYDEISIIRSVLFSTSIAIKRLEASEPLIKGPKYNKQLDSLITLKNSMITLSNSFLESSKELIMERSDSHGKFIS